ncbi:hypothetical protein [Caulobacter sp. RHG1]|uniref:hypothetical protein n=1 Tax=Caulobacter sp. (strain RHG1) TaxID=2545762 RepID=UPI001551D51B|nr:hypothetical protein [Caulobacter sp. RHG1]NQE65359.1 hypothetical protein [Caulobacter sp. RHG1]
MSFAARFRAAQPRWSRWLMWFVGVPAWVTMVFGIAAAPEDGALPVWGWVAFFVFAFVAVLQWVIFLQQER